MNVETQTKLQELLDREAIRDCLYRYCRGVDNADLNALNSAYWEDAIDCHGAYQGSATGFISTAMNSLKSAVVSIHQISNILIDYQPDLCKVESKFFALQIYPDQNNNNLETQIWGRYADNFEKRNDIWKIAKRTVIYDWVQENKMQAISKEARFKLRQPVGCLYPEDPIYTLL
ncbi:nuclear transport factor 2 family protein [Acinetobacter sp. YH12255]|uniref:nuclear transport factor 2 family protein n=1 Tax=Acinetobacter sp. YH12255 TaxID=2601179 RepID=UPI0015D2460A|nr:nuclear transport factor 2 family protein [Acinetobacter sp. YH12255]